MEPLTPEKLNSLKVADLKKELKDRGVNMPTSAKKSDLVAKLAEILQTTDGPSSQPSEMSTDDIINQTLKDLERSSSPTKIHVTPGPETSQTANGTFPPSPTKTEPVAAAAIKKVAAIATVDPKERIAARAARFGGGDSTSTTSASSEPTIPTPQTSNTVRTSEQLEALKKRSERFGEVVSTTVKSLEEKEKMNQRAKRFNLSEKEVNPIGKLGLIKKMTQPKGQEVSSSSKTSSITVKRSAEEEERLKKRRERFGLTA